MTNATKQEYCIREPRAEFPGAIASVCLRDPYPARVWRGGPPHGRAAQRGDGTAPHLGVPKPQPNGFPEMIGSAASRRRILSRSGNPSAFSMAVSIAIRTLSLCISVRG